MLPGTYEVSVPSPSLCWETTTLVINVQSATETIPTFVHTGYLVSVISSHTTQIRYKLATEQSVIQEMTLIPGLNSFCVSKFGQYDISFVGCHYYDDNLPTTLDTGSRTPITITATKHRNGIRILSDEKTQFSLLVEAQGQKETVTPTLEAERIDGFLSYRYEFRLKADELITVTPHSDIMLLKPESQDIMGGTDCVDVRIIINIFYFVFPLKIYSIFQIDRIQFHRIERRHNKWQNSTANFECQNYTDILQQYITTVRNCIRRRWNIPLWPV